MNATVSWSAPPSAGILSQHMIDHINQQYTYDYWLFP
jgi:hypothetical protein